MPNFIYVLVFVTVGWTSGIYGGAGCCAASTEPTYQAYSSLSNCLEAAKYQHDLAAGPYAFDSWKSSPAVVGKPFCLKLTKPPIPAWLQVIPKP